MRTSGGGVQAAGRALAAGPRGEFEKFALLLVDKAVYDTA